MSSRKRKATNQLTRPAIVFKQPISRSRSMVFRQAVVQPQRSGRIMQAYNWITSWFCPVEDMDKADRPNEVAPADTHVQTSIQRSDGTVTLKRQKTRTGRGTARPKSADDAVYVPSKTILKGPIDFKGAQDDAQRAQILNTYWEPPPLGFQKAKMSRQEESEEASVLDLDESLGGLQLDAATPLSSPPSLQQSKGQYVESPLTKHANRIHQNSDSPLYQYLRPSKSAGNLNRKDLVESFFNDEEDVHVLQTSTRKKIQLEVLREERQKREQAEKRQAAKQRRLIRHVPLKPLIQALDVQWDDRVTEILYSRNLDQELTKSFEGTELRVKDFRTLLGQRAWLNDEVINAYIEWITIAANKAAVSEAKAVGETVSTVPKFLAHNTFFWNILTKKGPAGTERLMKRKGVVGTALLGVDTVFIPINKGAHWTIALVRPIARTIEYLDSMGGQGPDVIPALVNWVKHLLGSKFNASEWKFPRTACAYQSNGYDCGVFVCTNALCAAIGIHPDCYDQRDLIQQRKNIAAVLLNKGFEGDFRWDATAFVG
ncbi:hypothetical protein VTL71DRAFT_15224 [Oculimacula yallundae]|uniref:Ubiquitin-like protease family profile domain-containing protein n=1 Tax=Oculimacula yallundae TaxID=86028 RepID=A0ABR4CH95_9HELO